MFHTQNPGSQLTLPIETKQSPACLVLRSFTVRFERIEVLLVYIITNSFTVRFERNRSPACLLRTRLLYGSNEWKS